MMGHTSGNQDRLKNHLITFFLMVKDGKNFPIMHQLIIPQRVDEQDFNDNDIIQF